MAKRVACLLFLTTSCGVFCQGGSEQDVYVVNSSYTGTIVAPASLGLPTKVPANGSDSHQDPCGVEEGCLSNPSTCGTMCVQFDAQGAEGIIFTVGFGISDPQHPQTVTLPDHA